MGEAKTKAPNFDYHKSALSVAARQAEVARDYLKRAARIGELNGHPPGSDGKMVAALNRYNGGRVLVFVLGGIFLSPPFSWGVSSGGPPGGRSLSKDGTRADSAKDFCRLVGGVIRRK